MGRRKRGWCWSGSVEIGGVNSLLETVLVGPPLLETRTYAWPTAMLSDAIRVALREIRNLD
jgi:hypothetical protein